MYIQIHNEERYTYLYSNSKLPHFTNNMNPTRKVPYLKLLFVDLKKKHTSIHFKDFLSHLKYVDPLTATLTTLARGALCQTGRGGWEYFVRMDCTRGGPPLTNKAKGVREGGILQARQEGRVGGRSPCNKRGITPTVPAEFYAGGHWAETRTRASITSHARSRGRLLGEESTTTNRSIIISSKREGGISGDDATRQMPHTRQMCPGCDNMKCHTNLLLEQPLFLLFSNCTTTVTPSPPQFYVFCAGGSFLTTRYVRSILNTWISVYIVFKDIWKHIFWHIKIWVHQE